MRDRPNRDAPNRLPPLALPFILLLVLAALGFVPPVSANLRLSAAFWGASGVLLVCVLLLRHRILRSGRQLSYQFSPSKAHYVQAAMQSCVYVYWGMYWPEVGRHALLILAQIIAVYALDMIVCWARRDKWTLGFGPFPIVLSTNLFLWFKDDWFFLQFLMVATGVFCKEFIKWKRNGRYTHVFNPSAISLFFFSVGLLITQQTQITWGQEIAVALHRPPHIYLEIFLVGLVVQALFSVTLVTLWAAAALFVLNLAYTRLTGGYHFIDSNIPVSVFIGLHLLVTDPATSPRTSTGKVLFGSLYGAAVFTLFGLLSWFGAPTFYDKLLCVPALNLAVPALDKAGESLASRFRKFSAGRIWSPRRSNLVHMAVWASLFTAMTTGGFLVKGKDHPGSNPAFWERGCEQGKWNACKTWVQSLNVACRDDSPVACYRLAQALNDGRVVSRNPLEAGKGFGRACDLGLAQSCSALIAFTSSGGRDVFLKGCQQRDGASCFVLGSLASNGLALPRDLSLAFDLFRRSCDSGWPRGCGRLGESYLWGEGVPADPLKAVARFRTACLAGFAPSCFNEAMMYRRGIGVPQNEAFAGEQFRRACGLGLQTACAYGDVRARPVRSQPAEPIASP